MKQSPLNSCSFDWSCWQLTIFGPIKKKKKKQHQLKLRILYLARWRGLWNLLAYLYIQVRTPKCCSKISEKEEIQTVLFNEIKTINETSVGGSWHRVKVSCYLLLQLIPTVFYSEFSAVSGSHVPIMCEREPQLIFWKKGSGNFPP